VEKIVEYFPEHPEESSFLYLVNLNPILICDLTLYLSAWKPSGDVPHPSQPVHFLMRGLNQSFPQFIVNRT
jgi:hypothetical protein